MSARHAISALRRAPRQIRSLTGAATTVPQFTTPPPPPVAGKTPISIPTSTITSAQNPSSDVSELNIDTKSSITNTVPPRSAQILVHTSRSNWASRIESEEGSRVPELKEAFRRWTDERGIAPVSILNTSFSTPEHSVTISILPHGWTYTFPRCTPTSQIFSLLSQASQPRMPPHSVGMCRTRMNDPVILICGHGERDGRCGTLGPKIKEAFQQHMPKAEIALVSHVGGHKYAGNCFVYTRNAEGKWEGNMYGRITPEDVPEFVKTIREGKIWREDYSWRGKVQWA